MQSPRIAQQWERAVVLRLGRYVGAARPGAVLDRPVRRHACRRGSISAIITTSFAAEQTLTSDTVPVNVDAVLFWMVYDAEKAALEVQDYAQAVSWAAQTALRDIIGRTSLTDAAARPRADRGRAAEADRRAVEPVGRHGAVGRDARRRSFPSALQDAMSREAQAAREKQARIILGQAEVEIAHSFARGRRSRTTTTRPRCTCAR